MAHFPDGRLGNGLGDRVMFLEKDLPIIGRPKYGYLSPRLAAHSSLKLLKFSEPRPFPGQSPILDAKGIPFSKGGTGTIKFRRWQPFNLEGG
jgi:hypothetical protein